MHSSDKNVVTCDPVSWSIEAVSYVFCSVVILNMFAPGYKPLDVFYRKGLRETHVVCGLYEPSCNNVSSQGFVLNFQDPSGAHREHPLDSQEFAWTSSSKFLLLINPTYMHLFWLIEWAFDVIRITLRKVIAH